MHIPDQYRGREQAYFKHRLLEAYLERLFMIVGHHERTICYVDCFAGPWQSQDEEMEDTSIGISLKIINKCREGLRVIGKDVQFKALYVEEKVRRFNRLQAFLKDRPADETITHALRGQFHELIDDILAWCGGSGFVFFFIDPTGWKNVVELQTLGRLLSRRNSELLINFMYDFLSRTVPQQVFRDDIQRIFGTVPDAAQMAPDEREAHLMKLYCEQIKSISPANGGQPRTVCVPVLYPTKDRTLYHLVYLTHHPKGVVEFAEASEKLEFTQEALRAAAKQHKRIDRTKQFELFSAAEQVVEQREERDLFYVREYWLSRLTDEPQRFGIRELANMIEETGWLPGDFQRAFGELERQGLVKNLDTVKKRRSKFVHFSANRNEGECLTKVKL
jgi:three-Cys-motif partner protein